MTTSPSLTAPLTPSHRTLLLKHGRSTVLLAVLPSTPLLDVKRDLLAALASRGLTTFPGSGSTSSTTTTTTTGPPLPLPHDDPAALEFGVLVDRKDASRGWRLLPEDHEQKSNGTSKAGGRGGGGGGGKGRLETGSGSGTVDAAGLVDGTWLAYRLSSSSSSRRQRRRRQQDDEEEIVEEEDDDDEKGQEIDKDLDDHDPGWNVVIATFEEADAAAAAREEQANEVGEDNINNILEPILPIR